MTRKKNFVHFLQLIFEACEFNSTDEERLLFLLRYLSSSSFCDVFYVHCSLVRQTVRAIQCKNDIMFCKSKITFEKEVFICNKQNKKEKY